MPLLRSSIRFCLCVPRVSFRALPSLHPGLCRSVVPTALAVAEYTHLPKWIRVLTEVFTCTYWNKYTHLTKYLRVLTEMSTRTYWNEYTHLPKCLRVLTETSTTHSLKWVRRTYWDRWAVSPKGQVKLVLLWGFAECGNRKALRLKAQGVYSCKWRGLNVDNNAASAVLCNALLLS